VTAGSSSVVKVLVVTPEAITADQLRAALGEETDLAQGEVMIVAPALEESPVRFWMSDADEAIARAQRTKSQAVQELKAEGIEASGDTGESDPAQAIEDALQTFAADRIVLFQHRDGGGYREDVDRGELRERLGVEIIAAEL
jgi:hypothetical protein